MTARESILSYLVTQITNANTGAGVYRSRQEAFDREEGPGISVQPEEEPVETRTRNMDTTVRDLTVVVTVIARADSVANLSADQVADPVIELMHAAVMKDITLGGRATAVFERGTKFDFEEADQAAVAIEVRYLVKYLTSASNLSPTV
jgi:hypothetical protein